MSAVPAAISPTDRNALIAAALSELEQGKPLRQISEERGIPWPTLRIWMLDDLGDEYKAAQRRALLARIAEADFKLETASDHVSVARARELARFTRFDAERRIQSWSPKQEISGPGGGPIQLETDDYARRLAFIKGMAQRTTIDAEVIQPEDADHKP